MFACRENYVNHSEPIKEVVRSLKRQWSKHAQAWTHTNSYFNKLHNERPAGESTDSTMRKQILAEKQLRRRTPLRLLPPPSCLFVKKSPTELPIKSGCILCQRRCTPLPEQPARRWGIAALVTAACATFHMIPTVHPLFHELNSYGDRGRRSKLILSSISTCRGEVPGLLLFSFFFLIESLH